MLVVATGCSTPYRSSRISFESQGDTMSGVLTRPTASAQKAVALLVFVHGDGASVADEYGYNSIVWNRLAEADIASLSWDKKGVGRSQGDWLAQSMDDRAQEVVDALEHIADAYPDAFPTIGLIGFSQAGWVLPKVVQLSSRSDFMIIVSGAINWERQGEYLTRQRMALEAATQLQIDTAVRRQQRDRALFEPDARHRDYVAALRERRVRADRICTSPMTKGRFDFVKRNRGVDATDALEQVTVPTLALFGDRDRNVDYRESFDVYRQALRQGPAPRSQVKLYAGATHSLLKATDFDTVAPDLWWILKLVWQGKRAFADGVLDDIVTFVSDQAGTGRTSAR